MKEFDDFDCDKSSLRGFVKARNLLEYFDPKENYSAYSKILHDLKMNTADPVDLELLGELTHRLGNLNDAENIYKSVLAVNGESEIALKGLSIIMADDGRLVEALEMAGRAVCYNPQDDEARTILGRIQLIMGRFKDATLTFREAIINNSSNGLAKKYLAISLCELEAYQDACDVFEEIESDLVTFNFYELMSYGAALVNTSKFEKAKSIFSQAIASDHSAIAPIMNLGLCYQKLNDLSTALKYYNIACERFPGNKETLNNRGVVKRDLQDFSGALEDFNEAIHLDPNYGESLYNRGAIFKSLNRLEEAKNDYRRVLVGSPADYGALISLAEIYLLENDKVEALKVIEHTLREYPGDVTSLTNLLNIFHKSRAFDEAMSICASLESKLSDPTSIIGHRIHLQMQTCFWDDFYENKKFIESEINSGNGSFHPLVVTGLIESALMQRKNAENYGSRLISRQRASPDWRPKLESAAFGRRIRVGYFSSDFRKHAVSALIVGVLENHCRDRFELLAYSFAPGDGDEMTRRVKSCFELFVDIRGLSDEDVVTLARSHKLDIAIDLNGFTTYCRTGIFKSRVAPHQINFLGFPGTMGISEIDYIIGDEFIIPAAAEGFYTEKVIRLPNCYQPNSLRPRTAGHYLKRAELGLPDSAFVFCCFNNSWKITPSIFDLWVRILRDVPGSVLWLLEDNIKVSANLRRECEKRGFDKNRLIFAPRVGHQAHIDRHAFIDLFLDTYPYNAHTTASDALSMNIPIITRAGESFASRVAGSLLNSIGLPQLVVRSELHYHNLAVTIANDRQLLANIKRAMAGSQELNRLFDVQRFARELESVYAGMLQSDLGW